jgi:hypothetical protein
MVQAISAPGGRLVARRRAVGTDAAVLCVCLFGSKSRMPLASGNLLPGLTIVVAMAEVRAVSGEQSCLAGRPSRRGKFLFGPTV